MSPTGWAIVIGLVVGGALGAIGVIQERGRQRHAARCSSCGAPYGSHANACPEDKDGPPRGV